MFTPLYCPNRKCVAHDPPGDRFFIRIGSYHPKCRPHPVPRFQCRRCRRTFSRQTFRIDYRDHRPHVNGEVLSMLASGVGLRQIAREIRMSKRCLELKARKIAWHLRKLHHNLMGKFRDGCGFALDELETFEVCRSTRPLTAPVLIEQESTFVVDARASPIPPSGRMTRARRRRIEAEEQKRGKRRNRSQRACARVLATLAKRSVELTAVPFRSDMKQTYPKLLADAFGGERVQHQQVHSKRKRDVTNPLHRINLTLARVRDLMGRLRRRTWLVSKKARWLNLHLMVFACYRNYTQPRFNGEKKSPAERLGFVDRLMSRGELLSWRQDHGRRSIHPLRFMTVADYLAERGV